MIRGQLSDPKIRNYYKNIYTSLKFVSCFIFLGDHWLPSDHISVQDAWIEGTKEMSQLWRNKNAKNIAAKYTNDCIFIHPDKGILRGRDGE